MTPEEICTILGIPSELLKQEAEHNKVLAEEMRREFIRSLGFKPPDEELN
jgi:hypothetical protein